MNRLMMIGALLLLPAAAQGVDAPGGRNPQIDFAGFVQLSEDVQSYREGRLLGFDQFRSMAVKPGTLILDARSASAYREGHIKGAVNLPFTDFTAATLASTIGDKDRPIVIYCNNNFANDVPPVARKAIQLALNIQTFVNLVGYGYRNVYELGEVVDFRDPKVEWQAAGFGRSAA